MTKIGVILSGCGFMDGSEIQESVLTLLAIDRMGASYQCLAPNIAQSVVINHLIKEEMPETRNVLVEAARIARGNILNLIEVNPKDFDALVLPGGYGAAKNLCNFALKGKDCQVVPEVFNFVQQFIELRKPVGFICIAPAMIPLFYPKGVKMTIGNDKETAAAVTAMGANHQDCSVNAIVIDEDYKVVSTPAYMLAESIAEAAEGIEALVEEIVALSKQIEREKN